MDRRDLLKLLTLAPISGGSADSVGVDRVDKALNELATAVHIAYGPVETRIIRNIDSDVPLVIYVERPL